MHRQQVHPAIAEIVEQDVPNTIDLWPTIQAHVAAHRQNTERTPPPVAPTPPFGRAFRTPVLRWAVSGLVVCVLLIGTLLATPVTRAGLQAISRQFGLSFIDPAQSQNTTTVEVAATSEPVTSPRTLVEAQQQVPFKIRTPQWVPGGVPLASAEANKYNDRDYTVSLFYRDMRIPLDEDAPVIHLLIFKGPLNGHLVAASREEDVIVQGQPAVYVHGGWRDDGKGDPTTALGNLQWDDAIDSAWLSWEDQSITYSMAVHNLGVTREDVLRIAESFR